MKPLTKMRKEQKAREKAFAKEHAALVQQCFELGQKGYGVYKAPCQDPAHESVLKSVGFTSTAVIVLSEAWNKGFWASWSKETV